MRRRSGLSTNCLAMSKIRMLITQLELICKGFKGQFLNRGSISQSDYDKNKQFKTPNWKAYLFRSCRTANSIAPHVVLQQLGRNLIDAKLLNIPLDTFSKLNHFETCLVLNEFFHNPLAPNEVKVLSKKLLNEDFAVPAKRIRTLNINSSTPSTPSVLGKRKGVVEDKDVEALRTKNRHFQAEARSFAKWYAWLKGKTEKEKKDL